MQLYITLTQKAFFIMDNKRVKFLCEMKIPGGANNLIQNRSDNPPICHNQITRNMTRNINKKRGKLFI